MTFADEVRVVVRTIPLGTVMTYQVAAVAAGKSAATRAVASIMARNFDPTIPCH